MSVTHSHTEYSIEDGDDDLRAEFDEAFDWEEQTHEANLTAYCSGGTDGGSLDLCCM